MIMTLVCIAWRWVGAWDQGRRSTDNVLCIFHRACIPCQTKYFASGEFSRCLLTRFIYFLLTQVEMSRKWLRTGKVKGKKGSRFRWMMGRAESRELLHLVNADDLRGGR